jgi:curved DNA-binding protein CbpA
VNLTTHPEAARFWSAELTHLLPWGVSTDATEAEIKAAYRRLVSEWHPDRLNNMAKELREIATERLKTISQAYELLIN